MRERLIRAGYRLAVGLDILLRLGERLIRRLQRIIVGLEVIFDLADLLGADSAGYGDPSSRRPGAHVAGMVDCAQRVDGFVAGGECRVEIVPLPGLCYGDTGEVAGVGAAPHLDMIEIRFHMCAGGGTPVPVDGDDAEFAGEHRHGRDARRRHILCDIDDGHRRPVAQLIAVGGDSAHAHLDRGAAVEIAPAQRRVGRHASAAPCLTGDVWPPFDPV